MLKAPFPWMGGKSRVAHEVWAAFGEVQNYVEPFFGSGAVLLGRPHPPRTETVNDLDCYVSNFYRALQADPVAVAHHADWPVNEADLLARHRWLLQQEAFREQMRTSAHYYDVKIAGWWVWGVCCWIGSGWCRQESAQLPHLGDAGMGIHRKLPHLGDAGRGIHRKLPHLGNAGMEMVAYFQALADRLRRVRVACGQWDRVLGESVTTHHGVTGVFLDPPYAHDEHSVRYAAHSDVSGVVRAWAVANGEHPLLRIALCGYEGEHEMPETWRCYAWKNRGGYGSQGTGQGRENAARERVWFSPHCLQPVQGRLL